jgi:hypothetical protein
VLPFLLPFYALPLFVLVSSLSGQTLFTLFFKARAWREVSFWAAPSWSTPLLELALLLAVWPTLSLALDFLWSGRANAKANTIFLLAPLNLVALVLVKCSWMGGRPCGFIVYGSHTVNFHQTLPCFPRANSPSISSHPIFHSLFNFPFHRHELDAQSRQLGTQLLGVAGLCLAVWHMLALSALVRRSQQRI